MQYGRKTLLTIAGLSISFATAASVKATSITVSDFSMESPAVGPTSIDSSEHNVSTKAAYWYYDDGSGQTANGTVVPASSFFPTTTSGSNVVLASPADGVQYAYVNTNSGGVARLRYVPTYSGSNGGNSTPTPGVSLGNYIAGDTYTLTYAGGFRSGLDNLSYTAAFTNGTGNAGASTPTVLATGTPVTLVTNGTFQTVSVTYTALPADNGQPIGLLLSSTNLGGGTQQSIFDNVQLSYVPEPATVGLAGIAVCGMLARRRRMA